MTHFSRNIAASLSVLCLSQLAMAASISPTGINVSPNPRDDIHNAIDGNLGTSSYLTPAFTTAPNYVMLEVNGGSATSINGIEISKYADIDGVPPSVDHADEQYFYTTAANPLSTDPTNVTIWHPVTSLASPAGPEQITATSVSGNSVVGDSDNHGASGGYFQLTFNTVNATGIMFLFSHTTDVGDPYTNFLTNEIRLDAVPAPEPGALALAAMAFVGLLYAVRRRAAAVRA